MILLLEEMDRLPDENLQEMAKGTLYDLVRAGNWSDFPREAFLDMEQDAAKNQYHSRYGCVLFGQNAYEITAQKKPVDSHEFSTPFSYCVYTPKMPSRSLEQIAAATSVADLQKLYQKSDEKPLRGLDIRFIKQMSYFECQMAITKSIFGKETIRHLENDLLPAFQKGNESHDQFWDFYAKREDILLHQPQPRSASMAQLQKDMTASIKKMIQHYMIERGIPFKDIEKHIQKSAREAIKACAAANQRTDQGR